MSRLSWAYLVKVLALAFRKPSKNEWHNLWEFLFIFYKEFAFRDFIKQKATHSHTHTHSHSSILNMFLLFLTEWPCKGSGNTPGEFDVILAVHICPWISNMADPWTPHFQIIDPVCRQAGIAMYRHLPGAPATPKWSFMKRTPIGGQVWHVYVVFTWMTTWLTWLCVLSMFFPYAPQTSPWSGIVNPNSIRDRGSCRHMGCCCSYVLGRGWCLLSTLETCWDVVLGCGQLMD